MEQPHPTYREEDIDRVILRDFGAGAAAEARSMLEVYGTEEWHREALRVRMACLKLANGKIEELKKHIGIACNDYRDVLAMGEYSEYMRAKNESQRKKAIASDWAALQSWLNKK